MRMGLYVSRKTGLVAYSHATDYMVVVMVEQPRASASN